MLPMSECTYRLRSAQPGDALRIHDLHTASVRALCSTHCAQDVIDGWLANRSPQGYMPGIEHGRTFVAEDGDTLIGFGEAGPGVVIAIFVGPHAVARGVGTKLAQHAFHLARRNHTGPIRLESTLNAVSFYRRFGFREKERTAVRRNFVEVPIVVMELNND